MAGLSSCTARCALSPHTRICRPPHGRCPPAAAAVSAVHAADLLLGGWQRGSASSCRTRAAAAAAAAEQGESAAATAAAAAALPAREEWVEVGLIGQPHGVRGEMKVQPLTDFPEDRLATPGTRWLQAPAPRLGRRAPPPPVEVELQWGRYSLFRGNEVWLVKLEGVESPEEAALLRGQRLLVATDSRKALEDEDEFYVQDLVGLRVFLQSTGEELGVVADLFDGTGEHDVLRIQLTLPAEQAEEGEGAKHFLLPFAKQLVPVVDLAGGRMEVAPPEGLLELAVASDTKKPRAENRGKRERRRPRPRGAPAGSSPESQSGGGSGEEAGVAEGSSSGGDGE